MSKINLLDKDVYNKIAAGEVVEKPASVVKELVENSIDAGSKNITIEILGGGVDRIIVSDDGSGINYDDFDRVFLAHATSKVKSVDDLSKISTLGFRGEALSSIASVSKVVLSSKTDDEMGYQVKCDGGVYGEIQPVGATKGTHIVVSDLFYNIPARKKFLRKPKLEENEITNYIARLILANPEISFKYIADNKIIYQSFGGGLYEAIYTVYGKSIVDNLIEVNFEKDDYKFSGFIGKPTFSKPNRTYQTLIINGRYVINQSVSTAMYKAYENFNMKGTFPFFVINLIVPLDKIDVNVHPNKLDVKFEDSNKVFGIIYSSIIDVLYKINNTKTITVEDKNYESENLVDTAKLSNVSDIGSQFKLNNSEENIIKEVDLSTDNIEDKNDKIEYESNKINEEIKDFTNKFTNLNPNISANETISNMNYSSSLSEFKLNQNVELMDNDIVNDYNLNNFNRQTLKNNQIDIPSSNSNLEEDDIRNLNKHYKIIGALFDTYILIEINDELILIDQHAGHERLNYDKFCKELELKEVAIQPLLIPFILDCNNLEYTYLTENLEVLKEMGFDMQEFGSNSYKVNTVPLLFEDINLQEFFDSVLEEIGNKLVVSKHSSIKHYIATKACKSAIKGNDKLTESEIEFLIDQILKPGQVLLCPHGRPIATKVTKTEIEKWFKRIV